MVETLPGEIESLKKAGIVKDWESVASIAHKMKSTVAYVGLNFLEEIIIDVIHCAREIKNLSNINEKINNISENLLQAHRELKEELIILT